MKDSGGLFFKTTLLSIDYNGKVTTDPGAPPKYVGRVSGSGSAASGQAAFTLKNITKEDERSFGCRLIPASNEDLTAFDPVQLEVKG